MMWDIRRLIPALRRILGGSKGKGPTVDAVTTEAASRLKSEILATMSHEIRTPMNAVLGMTDLLRLTNLTRKQLGYLDTIQSSGDMLLSLLDNTLDYARLEAGGIELQRQEFDVSEVLERVLQIMGYQAYLKGLELIVDFAVASPFRIVSDIDRLRQVLVNLVSNAVRYSEKGVIVIRVVSEDREDSRINLTFSVTDQGVGMSKELQEALSSPLESFDILPHNTQHGSGLGLTICKSLVQHMGGEIRASSVSGEGSSVWFSIPVETVAHEPGGGGSDLAVLENERALVINSNMLTAEIICRYFEDWGLDFALANDVASALSMLDTNSGEFSLAIIDKDLLDDDGLLLARQIRARRATENLPIILLTSIARPLEVGEISLVGNIRCVNKPVLPSELRHELLRLTRADTEFAAESIVAEMESEIAITPNRQLRVLIAEDNMVNSRMLLAMLCSLDCYPDIVENGHAALKALAREAYDLVLMDCQMPGLDGDQVTKELRTNPRLYRSQPVVIAVTADNSDKHRRRCLDSGMDGFIAKPIRLQKLASGLEQWPLLLGTRQASGADDAVAASDDEDLRSRVRSQLNDRKGTSGAEFAHNYIDLFLTDTASRLDKMRKALSARNANELSRQSHALKGSCLEFGVVRMGQYCDSLRKASEADNLEEATRVLAMLDNEYARVRPVFEAEKTASR